MSGLDDLQQDATGVEQEAAAAAAVHVPVRHIVLNGAKGKSVAVLLPQIQALRSADGLIRLKECLRATQAQDQTIPSLRSGKQGVYVPLSVLLDALRDGSPAELQHVGQLKGQPAQLHMWVEAAEPGEWCATYTHCCEFFKFDQGRLECMHDPAFLGNAAARPAGSNGSLQPAAPSRGSATDRKGSYRKVLQLVEHYVPRRIQNMIVSM